MRSEIEVSGDGPTTDLDERRPRPPAMWVLTVVVALAVGVAFGDAYGRKHPSAASSHATTPPKSSSTLVAPVVSIVSTDTCAVTMPGPKGHDDLLLGIEIQNTTARPVEIDEVLVEEPLHGLPQASPLTLGVCGAVHDTNSRFNPWPYTLESVDTVWYTVRLHVPNGACPAALPVVFIARYTSGGVVDEAHLGGFNDLGNVPYPSCTN